MQSLALQQQPPPDAAAASDMGAGLNFAHLWFLYYLLLFYAAALAIRALLRTIDRHGAFRARCDRFVGLVMRGAWAPVLIALPIAAYLWQLDTWNEWLGLPAPVALTPNPTALVGYGVPFALGWVLHRQIPTLLGVRKFWLVYFAAAVALTIGCLAIVGTTPRWAGPVLAGTERAAYTLAYTIGLWCWVLAVVGAAVRFLSVPHTVTRYIADASYWIYLMHMATLVFFLTLLRPYDLHWSVKLAIMIGGSLPILLLSYHYLVRFTWIGAILNGRRQPRPEKASPTDVAPARGRM